MLAWLQHQHHAGERLAELRAGDAASAERGIDDVDAVFAQSLEDDVVVELPVQDRTGLEILDGIEVDLHAAAAQPEVVRCVEERERRGAVATPAAHLAYVVERHGAAVEAEHHREASCAALGRAHLLHERHAWPRGEDPPQEAGRRLFGIFRLWGRCGLSHRDRAWRS